jgi:hypothetical protein
MQPYYLQPIIEAFGEIVIVDAREWGRYIGRIKSDSKERYTNIKVAIEILAVLEYPSQQALVNASGIFHRIAYSEGEIKDFDIGLLAPYTGEVPGYNETLKAALQHKIAEYETQYKAFEKIARIAPKECEFLRAVMGFLKGQLNIRRETL